MHITKDKVKINTGKAIGNELEELITKAKKRIWITSPWISEKTAKLLLNKKKEGVDVRLITTNQKNPKSHRKGLTSLIEPLKVRDQYYKIYTYSIVGNILALALFILLFINNIYVKLISQYFFFYFFGIWITILIILIKSRKKHTWLEFESTINLKIFKTIYSDDSENATIHIKSYVIDNNSYCLGSANFTDKGLWENIESLIIFKDETLVEKGAKDFLNLFNHPVLEEKNLTELGLAEYFK